MPVHLVDVVQRVVVCDRRREYGKGFESGKDRGGGWVGALCLGVCGISHGVGSVFGRVSRCGGLVVVGTEWMADWVCVWIGRGRFGRRPMYIIAGLIYWLFHFAVAK
jgi:hypothetical protein